LYWYQPKRRAGIYIKITPEGIMDSWTPGFQIILSSRSAGRVFVVHRTTATEIDVATALRRRAVTDKAVTPGGAPRQSEAATKESAQKLQSYIACPQWYA
jgi:hypothetical protein